MPSGLTHMIISRKVLNSIVEAKNGDTHALLQAFRGPYILGCVSPDLPYMTLMDSNLFQDRKEIADALHYKKTNQVPLEGLKKAKEFFKNGNTEDSETLFAFYVGYCSHIIADGIIHPFVRDMVGDYEVAATEHRILEMKLDVLIAENLMGQDANNIDFHEELDWLKDCKSIDTIFNSFSEVLHSVHGFNVKSGEIKKWIDVMDLVFDVATGKFPLWYQKFMGNRGAALQDFNLLRQESHKILKLGLPVDAAKHKLITNYMQKNEVDFFIDVLPKYMDYFPQFVLKAYEYVFEDGPEVDRLLPEINLDTGRLIAKDELFNKPAILDVIV